jgi:hypothetical protein
VILCVGLLWCHNEFVDDVVEVYRGS